MLVRTHRERLIIIWSFVYEGWITPRRHYLVELLVRLEVAGELLLLAPLVFHLRPLDLQASEQNHVVQVVVVRLLRQCLFLCTENGYTNAMG